MRAPRYSTQTSGRASVGLPADADFSLASLSRRTSPQAPHPHPHPAICSQSCAEPLPAGRPADHVSLLGVEQVPEGDTAPVRLPSRAPGLEGRAEAIRV